MNYKGKLNSSYVTYLTSDLYGETSMQGIERQFPVWQNYFRRFLPTNKDSKILDLGCGNGGFVHWLQELRYEKACGIDISYEQIEIANNLGIRNIVQAEAREFLSNKEHAYDLIFARDVLEHFSKEEIFDLLQIINKAVKPGGHFLVQTPNGESPFNGSIRYGDFTHELVFTGSSLGQVLRATGFKDIEVYPTGPVPKGLKSFIRYCLWKGIEAVLRLYMLIETGSKEGIFTQTFIAKAIK